MTICTMNAVRQGVSRRAGAALPITVATAALLAVSPLAAPGSLGASALATMLPFAAILAIAAVGQTLVIRQGGIDFSVAGGISLGAMLLTRVADQQAERLPLAVGVVLLVAMVSGLVSGLAVTRLGITPLIATLGVNAGLVGAIQQVSGGLSAVPAPSPLTAFALGRTLGVFNVLIVAVLLLLAVTVVVKRTVVGRRFEAVGAGPSVARALGIHVERYKIVTYVIASMTYATAGMLLAGFLRTPTLDIGNSYLLSTIAAVVVGGTALGGGPGSVLASAVGALFLTQLRQLMLASGAETSVVYLVEGLAICASMAVRTVTRGRRRRTPRSAEPASPPRASAAAPPDGVTASAGPAAIPAAFPAAGGGLDLTGITKSFPGVLALDDVSLHVRPGEVHALVGENGAGKSTLIAVAAGVLVPDEGAVRLGGETIAEPTPAQMREHGLAVVYQHPALLPDLTITENLVLGVPPRLRPALGDAEAWTQRCLDAVGVTLPGNRQLSTLSLAERHLVEIAKAFAAEPSVLVLDEPTEPLSAAETAQLFEIIRAAAHRGVATVYISHRLREVEQIADRLTVLRDGQTRGTYDVGQLTEDDILRLIVGRPVDSAFPAKAAAAADRPLVRAEHMSGPGFEAVTVDLRPGEIVGLAGIDGNGQRDFLRALAGLTPASGKLTVDGAPVRPCDPAAAVTAGIVYMAGDRHDEGLLLPLSVRENISLLTIGRHARHGFLRRRAENAAAAAQIERLAIKTPDPETAVGTLSGGNQQKTVFARSLLATPRLLLADEPTQGVDAGARVELYQHMRDAAAAGASVVVLSSDAVELEGLCDRVLIFSRGHVVKELEGDAVTESAITHSAMTSTQLRGGYEPRTGRRGPRTRLGTRLGGPLGVRLGTRLGVDGVPAAILAVLALVLGAFTATRNDAFLSEFNIRFLLLSVSTLGFIALGQFVVVMLGGIDLSVGPLAGFLVVTASLVMTGSPLTGLLAALLGAVFATGSGLANGLLVRKVGITPIIATLVTFFVLQGLSLLLRPTPGGTIPVAFADGVQFSVGFLPVSFVALVGLTAGLQWALHRTRWGVELRATGSDEASAHRLGVRITRTHLVAYLASALLTLLGGVMLAAQIGVGDATAGVEFTLTSIAAVVVGGTSIFGGRGSAVGVLCGALLLQEIGNVSTLLHLGSAWQYWILGALTVGAAGVYSRLWRA